MGIKSIIFFSIFLTTNTYANDIGTFNQDIQKSVLAPGVNCNEDAVAPLPTTYQISGVPLIGLRTHYYNDKRDIAPLKEEFGRGLCPSSKLSTNLKKSNITWQLKKVGSTEPLDTNGDINRNIYSASLTKMFSVATFLNDKAVHSEELTPDEVFDVAQLITVSNNAPWWSVQEKNIGPERQGYENYVTNHSGKKESNTSQLGMLRTQQFISGLDGVSGNGTYYQTNSRKDHNRQTLRGGTNKPGNRTSVSDFTAFLDATLMNKYKGAQDLTKLMLLARSAKHRGRKYLPSTLRIGSKSGSLMGNRYRHHAMFFEIDGELYTLVMLGENVTEGELAYAAASVFKEHFPNYPGQCP